MRAWKRSAALLLALCMTAVLLVGCGEDPNDEDKLSVVMTGTVSTVDPALAATAAERTVVLHLFDNLYRRTADGVLPAAAQSHQTEDNEDGTQTYTFRLRSDAKWSDGTAVTAGDFVYAWKRLVSPDTGSPNRGILSMVAGYEDACAGDVDALAVSAEDDHTLTVTLSAPCSYFVDAVCTASATMPVQAAAVESGEDWTASRAAFVSNGPFRRSGNWSDNQVFTLMKQAEHYDSRRIQPDRVEILCATYADAEKAAGNADVVVGATGESSTYTGDASVGVVLINQMATNMDRDGLRRAMSLVIDRAGGAQTVGANCVAAEGLVPYGIRTAEGEEFRTVNGALIDNDPDTYDQRCEDAAQLKREAGLSRPEAMASLGTVTLLYRSTPVQDKLARQLQKTWREKLGLSVTLQAEEGETFDQLLAAGEFTLALTELTALYNDASAYLDPWRSGDSRNCALIHMNAYDILMRVAAASTSAEARDAYLKDAEGLLLDGANVIPVYSGRQPYQIRDGVLGASSDGMGAWYFGMARKVTK